LKRDGARAETRFRLSPKRTSPFTSAGASVQSTAGSRGVRISVSNAGYTTFRGSVRVLATHAVRQFPLHFPSRASPCAIRFQKHSNWEMEKIHDEDQMKNEVGGAFSTCGGEKKCIQGFGGETRGKEPLGRPRHRWEDNIKVDLHEVGCVGV